MGEIGEPFKIGDYLATLSSNKLLDPPITLIVSKNKTESNNGNDSGNGDNYDYNNNEVIPASYPPKASTFI
jgi:hypothetical protein